ncbi:Hypothetical protein A7982_04461 [Minicystis rosea]|nr:Hypothetical protein A7982_04461 [Minicystis rosea]
MTLNEGARDVLVTPVRAPRRALEIGLEAGYTQGFGSATSDPRVGAGAGGTLGLSLDDRVNPRWSFGVGGQYQGYGASGRRAEPASLRGVTLDLHSTYHLAPHERLDPSITFGGGYRMFVESPADGSPSSILHGVQLGKIEFGIDVRPAESLAISPMVGVDVNLFLGRTGGPSAVLENRTFNTFVFAGLKGRFDVGGTRVGKNVM